MCLDLLGHIHHILSQREILFCIVGELALNYYNVPRVVHDLEICVPAAQLSSVELLFLSHRHLFEAAHELEHNIYTEHKQGYPRFRYLPNPSSFLVLFPDEQLGLAPLQKTIIPASQYAQYAVYSPHILETIPVPALLSVPMPRLVPLFRGLCKKYCETAMAVHAIAAEQLVDGMDLDGAWCRAHMPGPPSKELAYAMTLVEGKHSRIDYFSSNTVTCFIPDPAEAQKVLLIPGRGSHRAAEAS